MVTLVSLRSSHCRLRMVSLQSVRTDLNTALLMSGLRNKLSSLSLTSGFSTACRNVNAQQQKGQHHKPASPTQRPGAR
jgi:hypothetical protein